MPITSRTSDRDPVLEVLYELTPERLEWNDMSRSMWFWWAGKCGPEIELLIIHGS